MTAPCTRLRISVLPSLVLVWPSNWASDSFTEMKKGYDVILVGRVKAVHTPYAAMDRQYVQALRALELREDRT